MPVHVGLCVSDPHGPHMVSAGAQGCAGSSVAMPSASLRDAHSEQLRGWMLLLASAQLSHLPTPLLPDLDELWALVDYFTWGSLLGTRRTFNREIADRIVAGRDKYASAEDVRRGEEAAADLMSRLRPHLLRREKEVLRATAVAHADVENLSEGLTRMRIGQPTKTLTMQAMGRKREVVLWCVMPSPQVSPRVAISPSGSLTETSFSRCWPVDSNLQGIPRIRQSRCHSSKQQSQRTHGNHGAAEDQLPSRAADCSRGRLHC